MPERQWLAVGVGAMLAGSLVSAVLPSAQPITIAAASTAGAVGASFLSRKPRSDSAKLEAISQISEQSVSRLKAVEDLLKNSNRQVIKSPGKKLEDLLTRNLQEVESLRVAIAQFSYTANPTTTQALVPAEINLVNESEVAIVSQQKLADISKIIDWFKSRNINVESYQEPQPVDSIFDQIAIFLGQRYSTLKLLYKKIKINMPEGRRFTFRLTENEINDCTNFCKLLNEKSFLSQYRYLASEKLMIVTPQTNPLMINFITGEWFERFVYYRICNLLAEYSREFIDLRQIVGSFKDSTDFELDIFFWVDNQPLWVECKSGQDYNAYLTKYSKKYRKLLGVPKERAFLVIADLTDEQTIDYTNLWDITVVNINNLTEQIAQALGLLKTINPSEIEEAEISEVPRESQNKLLTFFNQKSLRPSPEYRRAVITALTELFKNSNQPTTINQVKNDLADVFIGTSLEISRSKIYDILRALMFSQSFLNGNGEPIQSFTTPIASLISLEPECLEQQCINTYAKTILAVDPNYLDDAENVREFEKTTGAPIPSRETIKQLIEV
jgi:hypothetical protein